MSEKVGGGGGGLQRFFLLGQRERRGLINIITTGGVSGKGRASPVTARGSGVWGEAQAAFFAFAFKCI